MQCVANIELTWWQLWLGLGLMILVYVLGMRRGYRWGMVEGSHPLFFAMPEQVARSNVSEEAEQDERVGSGEPPLEDGVGESDADYPDRVRLELPVESAGERRAM
jgi:hypothetical protein